MVDERTTFLRTLARVASAMDAIGVRYVVTGSMAAGFYGTPRMSADIDVLIDARDADLPHITKVLTEDFIVDPDVIRDAYIRRSMFSVIDLDGHVKVDIIVKDPQRNPGDPFGRCREFVVEGTTVKMLSPEDLVIAKLLWAKESRSEMQLRDIRGLLRYKGLDRAYVEELAASNGALDFLKEASDA